VRPFLRSMTFSGCCSRTEHPNVCRYCLEAHVWMSSFYGMQIKVGRAANTLGAHSILNVYFCAAIEHVSNVVAGAL
jgi:hypothetical protein